MPYVTVGRENTADIRVHYEDHGTGAPVVLVHGYLADGRSWEKQETALLTAGYRVITYDRRGGGASSRPSAGYDYDTLAADLNVLLEELDLRGAVLAGCCSGTGEVTRYLAAYGQRRVRAAALLAPLPPFLPRSAANPDGADRGVYDEFIAELTADRPAAVKTYLDRYYNLDLLGGSQVSDQAWQNSFHTAIRVSAAAALGCAVAWREDFRADVARITVPVLIVQGALDRLMPPGATGNRLRVLLADARLAVVPEGPHAIIWTHAAEVNHALVSFLQTLLRKGIQMATIASSYSSLPNKLVRAANGIDYAYRDTGPGSSGPGSNGRPPLVVLQHFRGNLDSWDPALIDALASARRVIACDYAGVGGSTGTTPNTVEQMAHDAIAFITAMGLGQVDLLGFSIGSFVAQQVVLTRPAIVRRLILASAAPQGAAGMHGWAPEVIDAVGKPETSPGEYLDVFFASSPSSRKSGQEALQRMYARTEDRDTATTWATREAQYDAVCTWGIPDHALLQRLSCLRLPVFVANGDSDPMILPRYSYLLAGLIPNAQVKIYPDSAHGFLFQHHAEFAADVEAFLADPREQP